MMSFFQLFSMGSKDFRHTERLALLEKCERLELKKLQTQSRTSFAFCYCPIQRIERRTCCGGDDKFYSCLDTTIMEVQLVQAVSGYRSSMTSPTVTTTILRRISKAGGKLVLHVRFKVSYCTIVAEQQIKNALHGVHQSPPKRQCGALCVL